MAVFRDTELGTTLLAAEAFGQRVEAVRRQIPAVRRADDIEAVHQMRVASRRLRAALSIFETVLPNQPVKRWRKAVKKVTRSLGAARDLDVQIEFVQKFQKDHGSEKRHRPGLERLVLRLSQQRAVQQPSVLRAMDEIERSRILDQVAQFARKTFAQGRLARVTPGGTVSMQFAQEAVRARLGDLVSYESYVSQPDCVAQMHEMRIAAKRLRYTLEIFQPVFGSPIKPFIRSAKQFQTLTGDLHDMDVWLVRLPRFIDDEKARTLEFFGHSRGFKRVRAGLDLLLEHCAATRESVYGHCVRQWDQLDADHVWENLLQMCDTTPLGTDSAPPAVRPPSATEEPPPRAQAV